MGPAGVAGAVADWRPVCVEAAQLDAADDAAARRFFEASFLPFSLANNSEKSGLFTGYYEAELRGSRRREGSFATPLLRRPPDVGLVDPGPLPPARRGARHAGPVRR